MNDIAVEFSLQSDGWKRLGSDLWVDEFDAIAMVVGTISHHDDIDAFREKLGRESFDHWLDASRAEPVPGRPDLVRLWGYQMEIDHEPTVDVPRRIVLAILDDWQQFLRDGEPFTKTYR